MNALGSTTPSFPEPPRDADLMTVTVPPQEARRDPVRRVRSPRIAALGDSPGLATVSEFWRDVEASGAPLIEEVSGGECTYTFVHRGDPETERVAFFGSKIIDPQEIETALFSRVPGTDIWWFAIRLGAGWRGSYAIASQSPSAARAPAEVAEMIELRRPRALAAAAPEHRDSINTWFDLQHCAVADPLARETARAGAYLPSVASGPEAPASDAPASDATAPVPAGGAAARGRILPAGDVGSPGRWWHIPAGPVPETWDVLVLLDGERWKDSAHLLEEWQAAGILPPTVTLLVGSGDLEERVSALTCSPELVDDLVRTIDSHEDDTALFGAPLTADPARTRIAGQSLGGLTALYAQCAAPHRFGVSVSQSGSFWWPNAPTEEPEAEWLTLAIERSGIRLGTVVMEVGLQEWVMLDATRRMRAVLEAACERLMYREYDGGHDEACWFASLPGLLRATVPLDR